MAKSLTRPTPTNGALFHSLRLRRSPLPWEGVGNDGAQALDRVSVSAVQDGSGSRHDDSKSNVANGDDG